MILGHLTTLMNDGTMRQLNDIKPGDETAFGKVLSISTAQFKGQTVAAKNEITGSLIIAPEDRYIDNTPAKLLCLDKELIIPTDLKIHNQTLGSDWWEIIDEIEAKNLENDSRATCALLTQLANMHDQIHYACKEDLKHLWKRLGKALGWSYDKSKKGKHDPKKMVFRGRNSIWLSREIQRMGWKLGKHTRYQYFQGRSILWYLPEPKFSIIDKETNKIYTKLINLNYFNIPKPFNGYELEIEGTDRLPTIVGAVPYK